MGSDKGLCGGINSGVSKQVRLRIQDEESKGANVKLMSMGNKPVSALKRLYGDRYLNIKLQILFLVFADMRNAT